MQKEQSHLIVTANVEFTHQRLMTLENRMSMMAKAILQALDDLKSRIAKYESETNFAIQNDANGSP